MTRVARRIASAILAAACCTTVAEAQQRLTTDVVSDPAEARFVYSDVENFIEARKLIASGRDSEEVLTTAYLDKASPGLKMFIQKYDLSVERLTAAMGKHPEKYAAISDNLPVLSAQESTFREAYAAIKKIMPDAVFPPTYFVVAGHRGIGSGSTEGPLVSIEKDSRESIQGDLAATLVHEMIHMEQLFVLNEAYFEIFNGPDRTLLALSVREGIATYFSELITGGSEYKNEARDFLLANEKRLWNSFKKEMLGNETGDWLWKKPTDMEQPQDIGYAIGARIAGAYYESAEDKRKAVQDILGVVDYPAFLAASGYEAHLAATTD